MVIEVPSKQPQKPDARVFIVQRILPVYRYSLFNQIIESFGGGVTICHGSPTANSTIFCQEHPGPRYEQLRNLHLSYHGSWLFVYQLGIIGKIIKHRPSVVILENNLRIISNLPVIALQKIMKNKVILWGHGYGQSRKKLLLGFKKLLANLADGLIFYNQRSAEANKPGIKNKDKMFVAHNSIDTEAIEAYKKTSPTQRDALRFLCIGRLIKKKKVALFLRAVSICHHEHGVKLRADIVGDGPERDGLEALAVELGLRESVSFHGAVFDEARLAELFLSCTASVSPGYVGLSAIHSLAYGLPVIVADREFHSPEIEALRDNYNAVFFPSDDTEALAQAMLRLGSSTELWEEMSANAVRTVKSHYSIGSMVEVFHQAVSYATGNRQNAH